jgi:hypothetical protein
MPITYYVFVIFDEYTGENVLVLSEFTNLMAGEYFICSKVNKLYGEWSWNRDDGKTTLHFDGVTSGYVNGIANLTRNGNHTPYYYSIYDNGILFWSQDLLGGKTLYYKIVEIDLETNPELINDPNAYVNADRTRAIYRIEVDGLYLTEATDSKDTKVVYFFDGEGNLYVNGAVKYTYKVVSYNSDNTASVHVTDLTTNKTYEAEVDYNDNERITFTLFDEVIE